MNAAEQYNLLSDEKKAYYLIKINENKVKLEAIENKTQTQIIILNMINEFLALINQGA